MNKPKKEHWLGSVTYLNFKIRAVEILTSSKIRPDIFTIKITINKHWYIICPLEMFSKEWFKIIRNIKRAKRNIKKNRKNND